MKTPTSKACRVVAPPGLALSVVAFLTVLGSTLLGERAAWAHRDPSTCNHPGTSIEFFVFRADALGVPDPINAPPGTVTPISGSETVSPCKTIVYQVRLTVS